MNPEFIAAVKQLASERGLTEDLVFEVIEEAVAAAYKKDFGSKKGKYKAKLDQKTGNFKIFRVFEVVKEPKKLSRQISLKEAQKIKKSAKTGDIIEIEEKPPADYGRIAAQTAKQVIIQKLKELEKDVIFREFKKLEGQLINGAVQYMEDKNVIIDLGKTIGYLYPAGQIPGEKYQIGQKLKLYLEKVEKTSKGPKIILSRTHPEFLRKLFENEVPEIESGVVEIKGIAREAGQRAKVAVHSNDEKVDAIGSCVGQRGTRIQSILAEVGDEKIDIIEWDEDPKKFIANAMAPAKTKKIELIKKEKRAIVHVDDEELSLAIGKDGQNVRLASKLTGWEIDVEAKAKKKKEEKEK